MSDTHPSSKVLIVGAGPTGLTLVHELLHPNKNTFYTTSLVSQPCARA